MLMFPKKPTRVTAEGKTKAEVGRKALVAQCVFRIISNLTLEKLWCVFSNPLEHCQLIVTAYPQKFVY